MYAAYATDGGGTQTIITPPSPTVSPTVVIRHLFNLPPVSDRIDNDRAPSRFLRRSRFLGPHVGLFLATFKPCRYKLVSTRVLRATAEVQGEEENPPHSTRMTGSVCPFSGACPIFWASRFLVGPLSLPILLSPIPSDLKQHSMSGGVQCIHTYHGSEAGPS
jgi:hypothetical protein